MIYMIAKFKHLKFRKKSRCQKRTVRTRFWTGVKNFSGFSYCSKSNDYNCNNFGYFVIKCRKPKTARARKIFVPYKKKSPYEDLKKENEKLNEKLNTIIAKYKERT